MLGSAGSLDESLACGGRDTKVRNEPRQMRFTRNFPSEGLHPNAPTIADFAVGEVVGRAVQMENHRPVGGAGQRSRAEPARPHTAGNRRRSLVSSRVRHEEKKGAAGRLS